MIIAKKLAPKFIDNKKYLNYFGSSKKSLVIPFSTFTGTNQRVISPLENLSTTVKKLPIQYPEFTKELERKNVKIDLSVLINETIPYSNGQSKFKQYPFQLKQYYLVKENGDGKYIQTHFATKLLEVISNKEIWKSVELFSIINPYTEILLKAEVNMYLNAISNLLIDIGEKDVNELNAIEEVLSNDNIYYKFSFFYFVKLLNKVFISDIREDILDLIKYLWNIRGKDEQIKIVESLVIKVEKKFENSEARSPFENPAEYKSQLNNMKEIFFWGFRTYSGGSLNRTQREKHFKLFTLALGIYKHKKEYDAFDNFKNNYFYDVTKYFEYFKKNDENMYNNIIKNVKNIITTEYYEEFWEKVKPVSKANRNISIDTKTAIRIEQNQKCPLHDDHLEYYDKFMNFYNFDNETYLEFHHIFPHSFSKMLKKPELINKKINLIGLCPICHKKAHFMKNKRKFIENKIISYKNENGEYTKFLKEIYLNLNDFTKNIFIDEEDFLNRYIDLII